MQFRIFDAFTENLGKLTGEEQRAAKMTAFDLQPNPAQPGLQFYRVDRAKDKELLVGPGKSQVVYPFEIFARFAGHLLAA